jgi:transcriptional regulator with XRE-family HTH domain
METMGDRLKWCRRRYGWTQRDLARESGLGLATVRRIEQGDVEPRLQTVRQLAETLQVLEGWLAFGEGDFCSLQQMTPDEQVRIHTGPGTEGLPGFVVSPGGMWYRDEAGEWRVDRTRLGQKGEG